MNISIEVSVGELIDKITILAIKLARISDPARIANVRKEHEILTAAYAVKITETPELLNLKNALMSVNEELWDIEDRIRNCERQQDFGSSFVQLARTVYRTNDRRAALKREINELLNSDLIEEKSYSAY